VSGPFRLFVLLAWHSALGTAADPVGVLGAAGSRDGTLGVGTCPV